MTQQTARSPEREGPPPILGSWPRLYAAVLLALAAEIVLFFALTRLYL